MLKEGWVSKHCVWEAVKENLPLHSRKDFTATMALSSNIAGRPGSLVVQLEMMQSIAATVYRARVFNMASNSLEIWPVCLEKSEAISGGASPVFCTSK